MQAIDFLKASFGLTLSVNIRSALGFCSDPSGLYLEPIAMRYPFCKKYCKIISEISLLKFLNFFTFISN